MKKILSALGLGLGLLGATSSWACDSQHQGFGVTNVQNEAIKIELQYKDTGKTVDGGAEKNIPIGEYGEICFAPEKTPTEYKMMQYRSNENLQYSFSSDEMSKDGYIGVNSNDPGFVPADSTSAKKKKNHHMPPAKKMQ